MQYENTFEIRGIYSTAIAQFLQEQGLILANPSEKQKERFSDYVEGVLPTWFIRDLPHHEGIIIKGYEKLPINLKDIFWDSFLIETNVEIYFYHPGEEIEVNGAKFVTKKPIVLKKIDDYYVIEDYIKGRYCLVKLTEEGIKFIPTKEGNKNKELFELEKNFLMERLEKGGLIFNDYELTLTFGKISRSVLDEYRAKVTYTIKGHHVYKPLGMSEIVDFSEINNLSEEMIKKYIFETSENLLIVHRKYNPADSFTTHGYKIIRKTFEGSLYIEAIKELKPGNYYDSTDIPIEEGDYAVKKFLEGNWFYMTEYYSKDGTIKLKYININTPIEIAKERVAYNDLEVDVIYLPDGKRMLVDVDKFDELFDKGIITKDVYNYVVELLERL